MIGYLGSFAAALVVLMMTPDPIRHVMMQGWDGKLWISALLLAQFYCGWFCARRS